MRDKGSYSRFAERYYAGTCALQVGKVCGGTRPRQLARLAQYFALQPTQHTKRHPGHARLKQGVTLLVVAVLLVALCLAAWALAPTLFAQRGTPAGLRHPLANNPAQQLAESAEPLRNREAFNTSLPLENSNDTTYLQLVNESTPANIESIPQALQAVSSSLSAAGESIFLHTQALEATKAFARAGEQAEVGTFVVNSGYRSYEEQAALYAGAVSTAYVQPPGYSEHHTGLAVDMTALEDGTNSATHPDDLSPAERWMATHAWEYGLILRYPFEKQSITQVAYEPWHFRYVGTPHAWYCQAQNLCMEEYLTELGETGGYQIRLGNKTYYVCYQQAQDGVVYVPEGLSYEVSSSGTGGYIITAWE